jgi:hypothetical protein
MHKNCILDNMDWFEENELRNNKTPNIKILKERMTVVAPVDLVEQITLRAKKNQRSMSSECLSLIVMGLHRYEILDTLDNLETNLVADPLIERVVDPIVEKIVGKVVGQIIPLATTIVKNESKESVVETPNVTRGDIIEEENEFDYQKILEEVENLSRDFKENPDITIKKYPLTKSNYFKYVLWYNELIKTKDSLKTNQINQDSNTRKRVLEKFRNKLNSIQRRWKSITLEQKKLWEVELKRYGSGDLISIP